MSRRTNWKRRLVILPLLGILFFIMLRWFEHSQVYHPSRTLDANGTELNRPFEDVLFEAADGVKLNGWFYAAATNSSRASMAVVVCHGNAGNISHRLGLGHALLDTGVNVLLFDYRGYGRSEGRPSEEGTYRDAQAAFGWLRSKGFAGSHIIAYGESLGGGVAAELALREPVGGLVLTSTFTSIPDLGAEFFPWLPARWLASIRYDTCRKLPRIRVPVLVMHSRADDMIRFRHGEKNFAAANEPKIFSELTGTHNESTADETRLIVGLQKLLNVVESAGSRPAATKP
jgi:fermentation-respiration switch protein FrsA (DUF1100 family)